MVLRFRFEILWKINNDVLGVSWSQSTIMSYNTASGLARFDNTSKNILFEKRSTLQQSSVTR
jgi:hypothetical protein